MNEEVKACPFCGGEASADGRVTYSKNHEAWWPDGKRIREAFFVSCMRCSARRDAFIGARTREEAIASWNTRTPASCSPDVVELVEQLIAAAQDASSDQAVESDERTFVAAKQRLLDALESMMREKDAMREALQEAREYVQLWTQEHGATGTHAQQMGNALLAKIDAALSRAQVQG